MGKAGEKEKKNNKMQKIKYGKKANVIFLEYEKNIKK